MSIKFRITVLFAFLVYAIVLYISPISCPIIEITGIPCLGCGMTRALLSALRFDFRAAFSYHFMFWSVPIIAASFLFDLKLMKSKLFYIAILLGFIANWIVKIC